MRLACMVPFHMYETNGNAAKNGELPESPRICPGVIKDAQNTKAGNVQILKEDEPVDPKKKKKNTATVGEQARVKIPPPPPPPHCCPTNIQIGSHPTPNELERFASYNNIFSISLYKSRRIKLMTRLIEKLVLGLDKWFYEATAD